MADLKYRIKPCNQVWSGLMAQVLQEAKAAQGAGEVPIGALVLDQEQQVLARGQNRTITDNDPTAHAEIVALRRACQATGNYRLPGCVLLVSLEPCLMCLGAMIQARIAGLVFAARDPRAGCIVSRLKGAQLPWSNHRFWVQEGCLAEQSQGLLQGFFRRRRLAAKKDA